MASAALALRVEEFLGLDATQFLQRLTSGYIALTGERPGHKQLAAWRSGFPLIQAVSCRLPSGVVLAWEYRLPMSNERIDLVYVGRSAAGNGAAVILELKGWRQARAIEHGLVEADGELHQHPELQALNYQGKLVYCHSACRSFVLGACVWLYHLPSGSLPFSYLPAFWSGQTDLVPRFLQKYIVSGSPDQASAFLAGGYAQTPRLLEAIRTNFEALRTGTLSALCAQGFGPSDEQQRLLAEILKVAESGQRVCLLVRGEPGSGKSYIAILSLLMAFNQLNGNGSNIAVLGYRNNRLLHTVRRIFRESAPGLDATIWFYAPRQGPGLAKGDPREPGFTRFRLVLCDEAQRLTRSNIRTILHRAPAVVFFYDDHQILNAEEEGWTDTFIREAQDLGFEVRPRVLEGIYRVQGGKSYHTFIENLLSGSQAAGEHNFANYACAVFDNVSDMIDVLREKAARENVRVALVAAFTESPGDRHSPRSKSLANRRVGYPLASGFELYRGSHLDIYWLMDERIQYPSFWYLGESNALSHCASIYGCQGFEADYVGVIWGRDFVWRDGAWAIGTQSEDTVGVPSLKKLMNRASSGDERSHTLALKLLTNRYRIFLTRGIRGTFIFCEDDATTQHLKAVATP